MGNDRGRGFWAEIWPQVPVPIRLLGYLALVLLFVFVVVFIGAMTLHNWALSYNLLVGNTNPDDSTVKVLWAGYLLSVTGWLAAPALIGAWVGELVGGIVEGEKPPGIFESLRRHQERQKEKKHPPSGPGT